MVNNTIAMTCAARLRATSVAAIEGLAPMTLLRTSPISGLLAVNAAAAGVSGKGTRLSSSATTTSYQATALLPISDVVVFDGFAGIRTWHPPA